MASTTQPKPGPSAVHVPLHAVPPRVGKLLSAETRKELAKFRAGLVIAENRRQGA